MKYLAFDIEIFKEIPDINNWEKYRPLGISCGATLRSGDVKPITWTSDKARRNGTAMKPVDLIKMIDYMLEQREYGFIPLTWNGLGFDFNVLAEESKDGESCADLAFRHVDMMFHFLKIKGYPLGLDTAAVGLKLSGKTEGMHGTLAPPMWTDDNDRLIEMERADLAELNELKKRELVLEYVGQDVITTLQVAEAVDKCGALSWTSRKGRFQSARFPEGWFTVEVARQLDSPNTSWMTDPLDPEKLLEWLAYAVGGKRKR